MPNLNIPLVESWKFVFSSTYITGDVLQICENFAEKYLTIDEKLQEKLDTKRDGNFIFFFSKFSYICIGLRQFISF